MIKNLVDGCKIVSKGFINTYLEEKEAWKNNKIGHFIEEEDRSEIFFDNDKV